MSKTTIYSNPFTRRNVFSKCRIFMQIPVILLLILSITSCTIIGSKDAFYVSEDSAWKHLQIFSEERYRFECGHYWVELDEVLISSETFAFGPIIPFIPSSKKNDRQNESLHLNFRFGGQVDSIDFGKEHFLVKLFSLGEEIQAVSSEFNNLMESRLPESHKISFQYLYNVKFQEKKGDLKQLSVQLYWPFDHCQPPMLNLERKEMSDNKFIVGPGS